MRSPRSGRASLLLALLVLLPAGCGGGSGSKGPVLVATWPVNGSTLPGGIRRLRITYDEPVRVLNYQDARVYTPFGQILTAVNPVDGDPRSFDIFARPAGAFPAGVAYSMVVAQGLAVDADDHYASEEYGMYFTAGPESEALLGSPITNRVTLADPLTFVASSSVPTPGGRRPVGLTGTERGGVRRVWVQLGSGAGTGKSLAWFAPGDAAMTEVTLTHAGDLVATTSAIAMSHDGNTIYAAWRDAGLGLVRVARVDVATATETGSVVLSPAASPSTEPASLVADVSRLVVYVVSRAAAGARLSLVDANAFVELDRGPDPGVDGVPLPSGAGPMAFSLGRLGIAPTGSDSRLTTVDVPIGALEGPVGPPTDSPAGPAGTNAGIGTTNDGLFFVQGLAGAAPNHVLQRVISIPQPSTPVATSDDVLGAPTGATAVRTVTMYPAGGRIGVILDSDVVVRFTWELDGLVQQDGDDVTPGLQALPLPATAVGADVLGFFQGATPP